MSARALLVARPRRWGRRALILLVGLLLAALLAGWLLLFSPAFGADQVQVRGTAQLTADQVREAAGVPAGVPLPRQPLTAIERRVAALPEVASARVSRDWPDTLTVTVSERQPLLAVRQPRGYLLVDAGGVGYSTRSTVPAGVVTVAVDSADRTLLTELAGMAAALPRPVREDVRYLEATSRDAVSLMMRSGVRVNWGSTAESALKADLLTVLLERKPTTSVDLSSPNTPAIR